MVGFVTLQWLLELVFFQFDIHNHIQLFINFDQLQVSFPGLSNSYNLTGSIKSMHK